MVYCGRPSKACAKCRERRIKCNLGRPQCRQCQSAHLVCPGYRNEVDLLFRNETKHVVSKHNRAERSSSSQPVDSTDTSYDDTNPIWNFRPSSSTYPLHDDTTVTATAFLFERYLRGSSFEWVPQMYGRVPYSSVFARVVRATALAAYSNGTHHPGSSAQSRAIYHQTLHDLQGVIESTDSAADSTLASVLLMSRFETLMDDSDEKIITKNWSGHVAGAFAIIQSRSEQLNHGDALTRALIEQTVSNYSLCCSSSTTPRRRSLAIASEKWIQNEALKDGCSTQRVRLHALMDSFNEFRRQCVNPNLTDMPRLICWAQSLESQMLLFEEQLSELAGYKVMPAGEDGCCLDHLDFKPWSSFYHIYSSHHGARSWNAIRMLRLTLHNNICQFGARLLANDADLGNDPYDYQCNNLEHTVEQSSQAIDILGADICASTPQYLRAGVPECTYAAACFLIWPLYVVGRVSRGPIRDFVRCRLEWIAQELHIKSASIAATNLDAGRYKDGWLHASYMF